jgi:hypothetical protein
MLDMIRYECSFDPLAIDLGIHCFWDLCNLF